MNAADTLTRNARFAIIMSRVDSGIREQVEQKIDRINEGLAVPEGHRPAVSLAVGVALPRREHPEGRRDRAGGPEETKQERLRVLLRTGSGLHKKPSPSRGRWHSASPASRMTDEVDCRDNTYLKNGR